MGTHFHKISAEEHADFLAQERTDPVTGEFFCAGDTIVLCASCGSAFLADTWEYMGGKHCNQTKTLPEIQRYKALKMRYNPGETLFKNNHERNLRQWWLSLGFALMFLLLNLSGVSLFATMYIAVITVFLALESQTSLYRLTIRRNAIELFFPYHFRRKRRKETIPLSRLKHIVYQERQGLGEWRPPKLILEFKSGLKRDMTLPKDLKKPRARDKLFMALRRISRAVPVTVQTRNRRDLLRLESSRFRTAEGGFEVTSGEQGFRA